MPFSLKQFLEVFGRQGSRDLICIYYLAKYDKICTPISLKTFLANVVKALEDRPPPLFLGAIRKEPCLNCLELGSREQWTSVSDKTK